MQIPLPGRLSGRWPLAGLLVLALVVTGAPAGATTGSSPAGDPPTPGGASEVRWDGALAIDPGAYVVTLLTGDLVTVDQQPDGRLAVSVEPADRDGVGAEFETIENGDDYYVIPLDASPYIPEQLDMELFNVAKLVRSGYHADDTGHLPVIISTPDVGVASLSAQATRHLDSIGATAAAFDAESAATFWREATRGGEASASVSGLSGVEKVWLDELAEIALDESTPLVGAPDAWDAGLDGTGLTVAVLDTGIDDDHPDLAGKVVAAENFTSDADASDENGHGTHVASTVAGTGAASDGAFTGVAPGAQLLNAKVCNASGSCPQSGIIAGMEWAAQQGAEIANVSIGGAATDGMDPLSTAVNQLTESHGTLFVIAAGNSGPGAQSVTTPGSADAALTVGAVDKEEQLASFSGRGPRVGDFALKPDITAPGVDIIAARGEDTDLGTPVDDDYTQASGTSMATPHVAGAAAIVLQQDPALDAAGVKAALSTTAVPHIGLDVFEQGGGRLDVPAALDTPVRANPAPLDLGYFEYPHDDAQPVEVEVTYTNRTDGPVTLDLTLDVTDEDGNAPTEGMLQLDPASLTIAAGEVATATVTLDVSQGELGLYRGYLVAEADGVVVTRTPASFFKEPERYDLTISGIDTEGDPSADSGFTVLNVEDHNVLVETFSLDADGTASLRVPPGTYAVFGMVRTTPPGAVFASVWTAMSESEVTIEDDLELVFDAREGTEINVDTPAHEVEPRIRTNLTLFRQAATGFNASRGTNAFAEDTTFQAAANDPPTIGAFEFYNRWQLADPDDPIDTPLLYDVAFPEPDAIPDTLDYVAHPDDLAVSVQEFHTHVDDHLMREFRHLWRPWATSSFAIAEEVPAPGTRTDYLAVSDSQWGRITLFAPTEFSSLAGRMTAPRMEYQPGEHETRQWWQQLVTPGMIEGSPWHDTTPQFREGDTLELFVPEFSDSQRGHWSWYNGSVDEAAFRLYEDGELIDETVRPRGEFTLSPDPSRVRMELDVMREGFDWWQYSTRTATAWEFDTEHTPGFVAQLVEPEPMDLDFQFMTGSPDLDDALGAPVVYAGLGHPEDYDDVDADGAVVFVRRGELTFAAKAQNAADAGAAAAVIFNNVPGGFTGTVGDDGVIPTFSLSMEQGEDVVDLVDAGEVTIEVAPGDPDVVPMLLVDYDVDLDLVNTAPRPGDRSGPTAVELQVRHQPGFDGLPLPDRPDIDNARLWISYDDGQTWRERPSRDLGDGQFRFFLDSRDPEETDGFASLRVEAWDVDGNRIEQEITRAWGLVPR